MSKRKTTKKARIEPWGHGCAIFLENKPPIVFNPDTPEDIVRNMADVIAACGFEIVDTNLLNTDEP